MSKELSRFKFDLNKAIAEFEDELKQTAQSEHDMKLYDKLMELYKTKYGGFELWSILQKSRYSYCPDDIHSDFRAMLNFLDFISAVVYDSIDDGEIRLVKLETVGKEIRFKGDNGEDIVHACEDVKFFIVNCELFADSKTEDVAWLKKSYDEDLERFGFPEKYDHLKISHKYLNFEDFINIINTIIEWSLSKEKAIADYAEKHGLTEAEVLGDIEHDIEACKDVKDLDLSDVVSDWYVIDNVK